MDLAENRFGKTWKHFLEVLKVDYNCSLADVCRDQHTTFGGMSSWMSRRGYSVKQAKADVVRDYYGGVEPSRVVPGRDREVGPLLPPRVNDAVHVEAVLISHRQVGFTVRDVVGGSSQVDVDMAHRVREDFPTVIVLEVEDLGADRDVQG